MWLSHLWCCLFRAISPLKSLTEPDPLNLVFQLLWGEIWISANQNNFSKNSLTLPTWRDLSIFYDSDIWVRAESGSSAFLWFGLSPGSLIIHLMFHNSSIMEAFRNSNGKTGTWLNVTDVLLLYCVCSCVCIYMCMSVTSQVWHRPQQASVVMRSPLQPGFWATKENSRTAQPRKPWSVVVVTVTHTAASATRRRRKVMDSGWRCMLGMMDGEWN